MPKNILIIDGANNQLKQLRMVLAASGYSTSIVQGIEQMRWSIGVLPPDLVFVHLGQSREGSGQISGELRTLPGGSILPIIFVGSGTEDVTNTNQVEETFGALQRLGLIAEARFYQREGHGPSGWSQDNLRDLCERVTAWFGEHLAVYP